MNQLDQIDVKILNLLQDNARISISEIGRTINMTAPAVTERVKRLEEKGIIQGYRADIDQSKLGKAVTAFLLIQTDRCDKLTAFCERSPEVMELHQISGQYNFLMKVVSESISALDQFRIACSEYGFTQTLTVLSSTFQVKPIELGS
ncbi:AsnC family transcriptional regulator [Paenibacillus sp. CCS19]|uniref:Lrp/AsnC family transcriptional regulator n=1 Tax=Paenibacillus sp. CCS19 TaxID=3158387 RepID=UPI0025600574|nr:winged helix-turn-helix transcriptional regulator [Paenibacillus cellulosilyticus]GMK37348.1 AsnC family transcriptional regulator [Paenibacillus cellulosilyticus]